MVDVCMMVGVCPVKLEREERRAKDIRTEDSTSRE